MNTIRAALAATVIGAGLAGGLAITGALAQPAATLNPDAANAPRVTAGTCIPGFSSSPPSAGTYYCTSAPVACPAGYRVINTRQVESAFQFACTNDKSPPK